MHEPSPRDLHALLRAFRGSDAATVAAALVSPHRTPHLVTPAGGPAVFTWCAIDALILAHLLGRDLRLHSRSPHPAHRPPLQVEIVDGAVRADPAVVLSFPHVIGSDGRPFTEAFCPFAHLFATARDHAEWAAEQARPTTPLDLGRADEIARAYAVDVRAGHRGSPRRAPRPTHVPGPASPHGGPAESAAGCRTRRIASPVHESGSGRRSRRRAESQRRQ